MKPLCSKTWLLLILIIAIGACQSVPKTPTAPTKTPEQLAAESKDGAVLTEAELKILNAFTLETDGDWMQAGQAYQDLAEKSTQPERSDYFISAALMFYNAERYSYVEFYFDSLEETDILPEDQGKKTTLLAGSSLGIGKIYQSLANLPDIESISDYRFKALVLRIRAMGVLAIGKPLESVRLRIQISLFLNTDKEIEGLDKSWQNYHQLKEIYRTGAAPLL